MGYSWCGRISAVELPDFFVENKDLVCFDGEKDLVEKTLYYLSHEEERKQIARNGHEKVKKFHTYQIRLKEIIETIENSRT